MRLNLSVLLCGFCGHVLAFSASAPPAIPLEMPRSIDPRLEVVLFADAPEIVTPIGAAVDARGRLFVLESHTHLAPSGYKGPRRDRVKIFEGAGGRERAARMSVFADDVLEGLNLAFAPDGTLHVCTAKTVVALPDRDGDGRCDGSEVVLRLETEEKYPHNQLLGLTFSHDGWMYVSRGNTGGSRHAWVGSDGRRLEAFGNGGDIVRCRPDGSKLERVATGFWNPFDLKFDRHGRLLCVDNDPDSRGPNRLVHIVAGGDYGFKSLYGSSGLHPYNAWDGELPGTLPMIAGIGESPGGVLDLSYGALPADYRDTIAATIWAEHTVSLVRLRPAGVSLRGTAEPFVQGGRYFRPVALAAAPDGTIYITDWVLKDYPNHGHGRIWKLVTRTGIATLEPKTAFAAPGRDAGATRIEEDLLQGGTDDKAEARVGGPGPIPPELRTALKDADPFVRHAATMALARPQFAVSATRELLASDDPELRLGALLALRRVEPADAEALVRPLLQDPDEAVRMMAMIWTGETELRSLLADVDAAASFPIMTPRLFEVWLATLQILQSDPPTAGAEPVRGFAIKRERSTRLLERIVAEEKRAPALRAYALRQLPGNDASKHRALLLDLARGGDAELRVEALRTLAADGHDAATRQVLHAIAAESAEPPRVRAEAIVSLGAGAADALVPLLGDAEPAVRTQAARTLRRETAMSSATHVAGPAPGDAAAWVKLLASGGDAEAGERVFFAPTSTCAQCHRVNGRGGTVGPDLSLIARTVSREQLIRSIVTPSEEISPQFQGWEIKTTSGEVLTGIQGHWRTGGAATLVTLDGRTERIGPGQVASFQAMQTSLMPEGLAALFSVPELRDLVAYLAARN